MIGNRNRPWLFCIENATVIVYIVLILGSLPFANPGLTAGVLLGGGLGLANFVLLIRINDRVFRDLEKPKASYFAFAWFKFGALVAILFFAVRSGFFDPVGLVIGFSDFVAGIFLGTAWWLLVMRKRIPGDK